MARVTVEDCIDKVESPYELVLVAKERATQFNSGIEPTLDRDNDKNTVISLREIAEEKITVKDLTEEGGSVEAEVALISIDQDSNEKKEIFRICDIYRARKIENENSGLVFEIAGTSERIDSFIKDITKVSEIEIVRSGPVALTTKKTEEETS